MAKPRRRKRRARRNDPNPRRRRTSRRKSSYFGNPPRRKGRRRRGLRRNPGRRAGIMAYTPAFQDVAVQIAWAGAGFIGTKFVGNMLMPTIGVTQPGARILVKAGLAYGTAWGLSFALGDRRVFYSLLLGGMAEVIQDTVRTYVSPMFPALAAAEYPMEAYPEFGQQAAMQAGVYPGEMGLYPEVLGEEVEVAQ